MSSESESVASDFSGCDLVDDGDGDSAVVATGFEEGDLGGLGEVGGVGVGGEVAGFCVRDGVGLVVEVGILGDVAGEFVMGLGGVAGEDTGLDEEVGELGEVGLIDPNEGEGVMGAALGKGLDGLVGCDGVMTGLGFTRSESSNLELAKNKVSGCDLVDMGREGVEGVEDIDVFAGVDIDLGEDIGVEDKDSVSRHLVECCYIWMLGVFELGRLPGKAEGVCLSQCVSYMKLELLIYKGCRSVCGSCFGESQDSSMGPEH